MAKPLIPAEVIYEHALALIDAEGAHALSARRLAADLKCSTRTLYNQGENGEELTGRSSAVISRNCSWTFTNTTPGNPPPCSGVSHCTTCCTRIRSSPN